MTCVVAPPAAMYTTDKLPGVPLAARGTMTPLARVSPLGRLIVDVVGWFVGTGPSDSQPPAVSPVTVRLPVTATAPAGAACRPPGTSAGRRS